MNFQCNEREEKLGETKGKTMKKLFSKSWILIFAVIGIFLLSCEEDESPEKFYYGKITIKNESNDFYYISIANINNTIVKPMFDEPIYHYLLYPKSLFNGNGSETHPIHFDIAGDYKIYIKKTDSSWDKKKPSSLGEYQLYQTVSINIDSQHVFVSIY
ncbi:MAG: hypothetical protein LBI04_00105 [Treponema sp.]|jgi:hypothetical protein|nr:hypothetical protein [Treponema sp.]